MNQSAFSSTLAAPVSSCPVRFSKAIPGCARYNFWPHGASKNCVLLEGAAARFEANLKTSRRCRQKFSFLRISRLQKDVRASFDDEFRSSQSIALGLHKRYKSVLQGGIANNLHDFIEAGVTAYSVGCTTEDLRKELLNIGTREADLEDTPVSTGGRMHPMDFHTIYHHSMHPTTDSSALVKYTSRHSRGSDSMAWLL
uniref:DUF7876 domain-containing protein n=1 Tax=Physcomitrium patens TaxID=3218 RepID=A0A7I3ZXQ9_PHYPA